jgi:hypothetical protein
MRTRSPAARLFWRVRYTVRGGPERVRILQAGGSTMAETLLVRAFGGQVRILENVPHDARDPGTDTEALMEYVRGLLWVHGTAGGIHAALKEAPPETVEALRRLFGTSTTYGTAIKIEALK